MPLDDREQRILAEIERQFYEEDPELARAVEKIERPSRLGVRLSAIGAIAGLAVVFAFFARNTWVALAGFALLVVSATVLVTGLRIRSWSERHHDDSSEEGSSGWRRPFGRG